LKHQTERCNQGFTR